MPVAFFSGNWEDASKVILENVDASWTRIPLGGSAYVALLRLMGDDHIII